MGLLDSTKSRLLYKFKTAAQGTSRSLAQVPKGGVTETEYAPFKFEGSKGEEGVVEGRAVRLVSLCSDLSGEKIVQGIDGKLEILSHLGKGKVEMESRDNWRLLPRCILTEDVGEDKVSASRVPWPSTCFRGFPNLR